MITAFAIALTLFNEPTALVGDKQLTLENLREIVAPFGDVIGQSKGEFLRVRFKKDVIPNFARLALTKAGVDYVLPGKADSFARGNLKSLRDHQRFLKALNSKTGMEGEAGHLDAYEWWLKRRVGPGGIYDGERHRYAARQRDLLPQAKMIQPAGQYLPSGSWTHVGPKDTDVPGQQYQGVSPISGRKNGIATNDAETIYTASAEGGVWKTTDGGTNWTALSDDWEFLAANCVAVHPTNSDIVYVGTGDWDWNNSSTIGIMKSTNGGTTWTNLGRAEMGDLVVTKIIVDPDNPSEVTALAAGKDGSRTGDIFHSTDRGTTWTATNAPAGRWDDIDLAIPNGLGVRVYYAVGGNDDTDGHIYKSHTMGSSWALVNSPSTGATQKIMDIACSKNADNRFYVITPGDDNIWKTSDFGVTWVSKKANFVDTLQGGNADNWDQDSYDTFIEAGNSTSHNRDLLYVGLLTLCFSDDGGDTWSDIGLCYESGARLHADLQCFLFINEVYSYVGSDGGIYQMVQAPIVPPVFVPLNEELYDDLCVSLAIHPSNTGHLMSGHQDTGTPASRGNLSHWSNIGGGDGGGCEFDQANPGGHYTSSQRYGTIRRYATSTATTFTYIEAAAWEGALTNAFVGPMTAIGSNLFVVADRQLRMYGGVPGVWFDFATVGTDDVGVLERGNTTNTLYTGSDNGEIYVSFNSGGTATRIDDAPLTSAPIGAIAVSHQISTALLAGTMGSDNKLYRCTNASSATPIWDDVSGGAGTRPLPDSPVNAVVIDPFDDTIWYVGNDVGCFKTNDAGLNWYKMTGTSLPNVPVHALRLSHDNYLYAATRGRGIWKIKLVELRLIQLQLFPLAVFGGDNLTIKARFNALADRDVQIQLWDNTSLINTPDLAILREGTSQVSVMATTLPLTTAVTRTISARYKGVTVNANVTLHPKPTLTSLELSPNTVKGGSPFTGTVQMNRSTTKSCVVALSDNSTLIGEPTNVVVPTGAVQANFAGTTMPVSSNVTREVRATFGTVTKTANLTLTP